MRSYCRAILHSLDSIEGGKGKKGETSKTGVTCGPIEPALCR